MKKNCRPVHLHNQSTESKIYLIPLYKTCLSLTCKQAEEIQALKKSSLKLTAYRIEQALSKILTEQGSYEWETNWLKKFTFQ